MSRYTGPVCKECRREGKKLFLKGDRCYTGKCALERRSYAPGQHGQNRSKNSEYGLQLRAKQAARRYYGIQEGQFHKYFLMAERKTGMTGENLLKAGDSVAIKSKSRDSVKIKAVLEANASRPVPTWLSLDANNLEAKVVALPEREQITTPVEEHLIVEFYSK